VWLVAVTVLLAVLILLPVSGFTAQLDNWERITSTPWNAAGGLGQATAYTGDSIYVVRAYSTGPIDFWVYSFSTNGWNRLAVPENLPRPKNGTALAWNGEGVIYVLFGGAYNDLDRRYFGRFDIPEGNWTFLSETPQPQGAGDALAYAHVDGARYLYALVGAEMKQRSGARSAFLRYDICANEWADLNTMPLGWCCVDDGAALTWDGGHHLYALHGCDCGDNPTCDFARYDLQTGEWRSLAPVPEPVNDGGSLVWDRGKWIYAITGGNGEKESDGLGFYRFSLETLSWDTSLPKLPCPVGEWNGNRLGMYNDRVFFWQGSSKGRLGGGKGIWMLWGK